MINEKTIMFDKELDVHLFSYLDLDDNLTWYRVVLKDTPHYDSLNLTEALEYYAKIINERELIK